VQPPDTQTWVEAHMAIAHVLSRHMPPAQACVELQTLPHEPQFESSADTSTHAPPHATFGGLHVGLTGAEPLQPQMKINNAPRPLRTLMGRSL
jgi:hypothetical protein